VVGKPDSELGCGRQSDTAPTVFQLGGCAASTAVAVSLLRVSLLLPEFMPQRFVSACCGNVQTRRSGSTTGATTIYSYVNPLHPFTLACVVCCTA
jgi:hypothetical protein